MAAKKQRQVKLHPHSRILTYRNKVVPQLKISGVWLEKVGFRADEHVIITVEHEKLTIQPAFTKVPADKPAYATPSVKTPEVKKSSAGKAPKV